MLRWKYKELHRAILALACTAAFLGLFFPQSSMAQQKWIATWAASPEAADPDDPDEPLLKIEDQTVRERVRVSLGGAQVRLRLSNEFGTAPLDVGAVTVALPTGAASVKAGTTQAVTFGGRNSIRIPVSAPVLSDPIDFPVAPGGELAISLFFPKHVVAPTLHSLALKHGLISKPGDHTHDENIERGTPIDSSLVVTAVLVPAQPGQRLVVAFGDSITDGDGSTMDAEHNWPSDLIRRLQKTPGTSNTAVVNEGIAGNRLLSDWSVTRTLGVNALARFDRDALAIPGVTHIVLLEGVNDIGFPGASLHGQELADAADARTADDVIGALRQLIARAHVCGIKVIGATMTPFEGVTIPGYYSEEKEATRQVINKWIRTSGTYDGVIDFDAVLRDPDHPSRILPVYASPDHLHPNDAGYQAMADAIDLSLFR